MKLFFFKYIIPSLILFLTSALNMHSQVQCNLDVDSLFQNHFLSLDKTIGCDSNKKFVQPADAEFIYLIGFLSGITFEMHSYTGQPQINNEKLLEYKTWYNKNRKKIKCENLLKGLQLLKNEITEDVISELDELKIE